MAFTDSGPEIVLLGRKSRDDEETRNLFELLQQVRPDCVPREVLHSLFLTLEDDRQIKINTELVETDIEYKNLTKYLEKMGIRVLFGQGISGQHTSVVHLVASRVALGGRRRGLPCAGLASGTCCQQHHAAGAT